jgi:hypothetical protein
MLLNKVKSYAIGVLFAFLLIVAWQLKVKDSNLQFANQEKQRYFNNWLSAQSEADKSTHQVYREKEVSGKLKSELDSLAKLLKVRPKQITKIEYVTQVIHDTINVPVQITPFKDFWSIKDSAKCWIWEGEVRLTDERLTVKRTNFDYKNKTTEVYYRQRPKHFLFIRYGKFRNYKDEKSDCGNNVTKSFEFIK